MAKKKCPRCEHLALKPAGKIRAGPRGGFRQVRYCERCGYRKIE